MQQTIVRKSIYLKNTSLGCAAFCKKLHAELALRVTVQGLPAGLKVEEWLFSAVIIMCCLLLYFTITFQICVVISSDYFGRGCRRHFVAAVQTNKLLQHSRDLSKIQTRDKKRQKT